MTVPALCAPSGETGLAATLGIAGIESWKLFLFCMLLPLSVGAAGADETVLKGFAGSARQIRLDSRHPALNDSADRRVVRVSFRAMEASHPFDPATPPPAISIDPRLEDVRTKLEQLHYAQYSLLATGSRDVSMLKKETVTFHNGHTLTVRPLYIQDRRVGLWMKWNDGSGMNLLDTRMHLDCGEHLVTGTESDPQRGIILVVKVQELQ